QEQVGDTAGGSAQVVVEKLLPLKDMALGAYTLNMKVVDKIKNQTLNETANFQIIESTKNVADASVKTGPANKQE
ncbi:MAG: hypothetical protein ABI823_13875, partial [Bryobacteraceae bacterium]